MASKPEPEVTPQEQPPMRIEYMALDDVFRLPRNPKTHDLDEIGKSFARFGFVDPPIIDERTGTLGAGHGRLDTLVLKRDAGEEPPKRIAVREDGEWLVPVIRGIDFESNRELEAYAIAANRLVEVGGWDFPKLASIVADLANEGDGNFDGLGYEETELKRLLGMGGEGDPGGTDPEENIKMVTCPGCGHAFPK